MKFLFLLLNLVSDQDAMATVARCCFNSALTSLAFLFGFTAYQAIRRSGHRRPRVSA